MSQHMAVAGDAANMSLGGGVYEPLDLEAVINMAPKGVFVALAAGNESDDANNHSPARANGVNLYSPPDFLQEPGQYQGLTGK